MIDSSIDYFRKDNTLYFHTLYICVGILFSLPVCHIFQYINVWIKRIEQLDRKNTLYLFTLRNIVGFRDVGCIDIILKSIRAVKV